MKVVFLDRDGTITIDKGYTYEVQDFELVPKVIEGLQLLAELGYRFIVVTNQAGIGRGLYHTEDFWKFNNHMVEKLKLDGISIVQTYFSPFHPKEGIGYYKKYTECRKPGIGMLKQAAKEYQIDINSSWMIGDKWLDIKTGKDFGIKSILVAKEIPINPFSNLVADYIATDMLNAAIFINNNTSP